MVKVKTIVGQNNDGGGGNGRGDTTGKFLIAYHSRDVIKAVAQMSYEP
jgi:hypothetical protein